MQKDTENDRVLAEDKDKVVIIDGERKKECDYLVPNTKMNLLNNKYAYLVFQTILKMDMRSNLF
jgi:hypothetical protein